MWKANTVPFFTGKVGIFSSSSVRDSRLSPANKRTKDQSISKLNKSTIMEPNLNDYEKIMVVGQGKVHLVLINYSYKRDLFRKVHSGLRFYTRRKQTTLMWY